MDLQLTTRLTGLRHGLGCCIWRGRVESLWPGCVSGERERARAFLSEVAELGGFDSTDLGGLGRIALALDDPALVERLAARIEVESSVDEHAQVSARAQLAEAAGDHEAAAHLYQQAAAGWEQFGNVPELAYAVLGRGRCLQALCDPAAKAPLSRARDLFATLAYKPALVESEKLLGSIKLAAS